MNKVVALGLGTALALQATAASGQENATAGISYDCDTPADRFSDLVLPTGPAPILVTGKVRLVRVAKSNRFLPGTRLSITSEAGVGSSDEGWAGFEYLVLPASSDPQTRGPQLAFSLRQTGSSNAQQMIGKPSAEEVAFSLAYDGTEVVVTVDGKERRMPFAADLPAVKIMCSTGEFVYSDLRVRPQD